MNLENLIRYIKYLNILIKETYFYINVDGRKKDSICT